MKADDGVEVQLHYYLINKGKGRFTSGKKNPGGPWRRSGHIGEEKNLLPPRKIDPRIVHAAVALLRYCLSYPGCCLIYSGYTDSELLKI